MKQLLYITTNLQGSGGVARILSVKLNYLIEKYHYKIAVINSNQDNDDFFFDFDSRIIFYAVKSKSISTYRTQIRSCIKKVNPDIIINCDNGLKGSLIPYLIKNKIPLIYERHCSRNISVATILEKVKLIISNLFLRINSDSYNYFVILNEEEKNDWNIKNIKVLPNPLWFSPLKLGNVGNTKIAVAVGRHSCEKRYDKLINIWQLVIKQHPDWILKIYGAKDENLSLEKIVLDKKLESNIKFYNPVKDISKIFSEASMLLSTSESESFGLVLIEAMAFGKPVVAFDGTSGTKTIIENGKNGFLVKENDIDAFVEKVNLLIGDVKLRGLMGENAKKGIETYDLNKIMKRWHTLFKSLN